MLFLGSSCKPRPADACLNLAVNRVASKCAWCVALAEDAHLGNIGPSQIDAHPGLDPGRIPCSTTRLGRLGTADKSENEGRRRLGGSEPSRNDLCIEEQMHHDVVCRCSCECIGSMFVLRRGIAHLGCC